MSTEYIDFPKLKERVSLHQCMQMLGLDFPNKAGSFRGRCPAHPIDDRSLVITPGKGFTCFAAKRTAQHVSEWGGDQIQLVAHCKQCKPYHAAQLIAEYFGEKHVTVPKATVPPVLDPEVKTGLAAVAAYLQPAHEAVAALGITEDTAKELGIGFAPKGTKRGRVLIPIHDRNGTLLEYCGIGDNPQFLFSSNFNPATALWNCHRVKDGDLFVCRNVLDGVLAYQNGIENVAAFLTDQLSADQLTMLASLMDDKGNDTVELV